MLETIGWKKDHVRLIDQTQLPHRYVVLKCRTPEALWKAVRRLAVRGAPALGLAAAFGVCLAVQRSKAKTSRQLVCDVKRAATYLASARPTAENLFWALDRMKRLARARAKLPLKQLKQVLFDEARAIQQAEDASCQAIARFGRSLISSGDTVLTHCNAGSLATGRYGTALAVVYGAQRQGKRIRMIATETRPLLQGARLTTWELKRHGLPVTLICDSMVATCMQQGLIDKVVVGADRIARNGDTANKIGTYMIAVLAKEHGIPFYVVAPRSTFDFSISSGNQIPIEVRDGREITEGMGRRIAPRGIKAYNPAFDVTPARLITAFVTDRGVFRPPYHKTLKCLAAKDGAIAGQECPAYPKKG